MIEEINKKDMVKKILAKGRQEVSRGSNLIRMEEKYTILKKPIRLIHLCSDLQFRRKIEPLIIRGAKMIAM